MNIFRGSTGTDFPQPGQTRIIICADDFGQSEAIDSGISQLVKQGRLSAVSCLSEGPCFARHISAIADQDIDIGLHLDFTEALGQQGLYLPISRLIAMNYLAALNSREIAAQIIRQLDAFERHAKRAPDFIDGHQHVHQLPQIRKSLLAVLSQRYPSDRPWLRHTKSRRCPGLPTHLRFKAAVIEALGANALARLARKHDFAINRRFLGVYDFSPYKPGYSALLAIWLSSAQSGDVLMCHPASAVSAGDALGEQRVREFEVLTGDFFAKQLNRLQVLPIRFRSLVQ